MADQNRTDADWEDVRVFIALARHGSLSATARALSVNHATVARRIRSLERTLGERLVERRPDGYVLTPAGTLALAPASDMEVAAAILTRGASIEHPMGLVRINAPPSVSHGFLIEHLARLSVTHPGLDVDVATDVRSVSLDRRETDIALRYGKPEDGDVVAKKLVNVEFAFYATSDYCSRIEAGAEPVFVGFDEQNSHLPEATWLSRNFPRARMSFRTNNQLAQAVAARSGAGIAMLPYFVGQAEPELQRIKLKHAPPTRELWQITRLQDRKDRSIDTVVQFLARLFGEKRLFFEEASRVSTAVRADS